MKSSRDGAQQLVGTGVVGFTVYKDPDSTPQPLSYAGHKGLAQLSCQWTFGRRFGDDFNPN